MASNDGVGSVHPDASREPLPREVERLFPRMREIARIVYLNGSATAREIQDAIEDPLTLYGIRTMLNRLIRRGIIKSRKSGRHREIIYLPGILNDGIRELALARMIEHDFDGSCQTALQSTLLLIRAEADRTPNAWPLRGT